MFGCSLVDLVWPWIYYWTQFYINMFKHKSLYVQFSFSQIQFYKINRIQNLYQHWTVLVPAKDNNIIMYRNNLFILAQTNENYLLLLLMCWLCRFVFQLQIETFRGEWATGKVKYIWRLHIQLQHPHWPVMLLIQESSCSKIYYPIVLVLYTLVSFVFSSQT
jgi:hypothetical protein